MRVCASCGVPDRSIGGGDEPEHWVKPEIRYIHSREAFSKRDEAKGWQYRVFQGRPALERMQCVECLRRNAERDQLWKEMRDRAKELETGSSETQEQVYFKALCE